MWCIVQIHQFNNQTKELAMTTVMKTTPDNDNPYENPDICLISVSVAFI